MKITHLTFIYFITFIFIPFLVYASGVNLQVTINGTCGNGTIDSGEECDGSNLNGKSCSTQGFSGGTLSCNSNCIFNTSACISGGGGGGGGGVISTLLTPPISKLSLPTGDFNNDDIINFRDLSILFYW